MDFNAGMVLIALFSVTVFVGCYGFWRYKQIEKARKTYEALMPPRNRLSWKNGSGVPASRAIVLAKATLATSPLPTGREFASSVRTEGYASKLDSRTLQDPAMWAAAGDGAIAGSFVAHAALSIDPQVLNAIEFSTADHLHSLPSIDTYVHDHFFAVPIHSVDGWFERLTGYVAEQKAASALEQMGHQVVFAPVANQPVWDLLVDGHPVQIKEGLAGAKDFIAHHPGIDVFTGKDVAAAIKDPAVHGLDALNKDAIHAGTHDALANIHQVVSPEFHLPFITMAFSSWREAKLLWNEKTTFERALVHVGLDVAGVGGGAFAGAKAGALAGSLGGPIGAAVGGFVGAIFGGLGGKLISTGIRRAPFSSALEEYNTAIADAECSVNAEITASRARVEQLRGEYQQKFLEERRAVEAFARNRLGAVRNSFDGELYRFCRRFPGLLNELKQQLQDEREGVLAQTPGSGLLAFLFPKEVDLYRKLVNEWFDRATKRIDTVLFNFAKIEDRSAESLYGQIQIFLNRYSFELQSMRSELTQLEREFSRTRKEATEIGEAARSVTESVRSGLIRDFGKRVEVLHLKIVDEIKRWNLTIDLRRNRLKEEAGAVGINL